MWVYIRQFTSEKFNFVFSRRKTNFKAKKFGFGFTYEKCMIFISPSGPAILTKINYKKRNSVLFPMNDKLIMTKNEKEFFFNICAV